MTYELMAADMAATGAGYESVAALSSIGDPSVAGTLMFVMSIGILGGMLGVLVFGKRIQMGVLKARSRNGRVGGRLTGVSSLASIEAFLPRQVIKGQVFCAVALTSCLATVVQMMLVKKFKILWYRNFIMAVTLIVCMASSLIWVQVLG